MNSGVGTETTEADLLEQFQIRRDGRRRGIAKNFLYEIKKMEEEVHEYLQRCPAPDHPAVKTPV